MDLRQIRLFVALAEELHFGRAAERCHVAQPALSAQLKTLEERLGVKLVDRTTRSVSLTRAGETFLPEARAALAQAEAAFAAAREAGAADLLKVGGVDSATAGLLPGIVRGFRRARPEVEVKIFEMLSVPALQGLARKTLDVAFIRVPPRENFIEHRFVMSEPILVALPADHPRAGDRAIDPADIAGEPLVIPARSHRPILFDLINRYLAGHGVSPRILQEANERHLIIAMVASGLGVSMVPAWVSQFRREDVVYRPFSDGGPKADVLVAWRRDERMAAVHDFLARVPERDA